MFNCIGYNRVVGKALLFMVLTIALSVFAGFKAYGEEENRQDIFTSIIRLLSFPDSYNGKRVVVVGYLVKKNMYTLYLTKDDGKYGVVSNAIDISLDNSIIKSINIKKCLDRYVLVEGVFDNSQTRLGLVIGGLSNISRLSAWSR